MPRAFIAQTATDQIQRSGDHDLDAPLDIARHVEANMPSDRPGLIMRRRLLELVHAHGEEEVTGYT